MYTNILLACRQKSAEQQSYSHSNIDHMEAFCVSQYWCGSLPHSCKHFSLLLLAREYTHTEQVPWRLKRQTSFFIVYNSLLLLSNINMLCVSSPVSFISNVNWVFTGGQKYNWVSIRERLRQRHISRRTSPQDKFKSPVFFDICGSFWVYTLDTALLVSRACRIP